jgi:dienelactone hydrolase
LLGALTGFTGNAQPAETTSDTSLSLPAYATRMVRAPQPGVLADFFAFQPVTFLAEDGLPVTGNLYEVSPHNPVILLCHQANYNKYEYADIAPRLNALGYNVLAIDQRSGGFFAGNPNETRQRAEAGGWATTGFLDAEKDILAAIEWLADRYRRQVIVWGSSYSSALAIFVTTHTEVKAAVAFSPGNYFQDAKPDLKAFVHKLQKPLFITSSREEAEELEHTIGKSLNGLSQVQFIPQSGGFHGSKALWEGQVGAEEYWTAVLDFLLKIQSY